MQIVDNVINAIILRVYIFTIYQNYEYKATINSNRESSENRKLSSTDPCFIYVCSMEEEAYITLFHLDHLS